MQGLCQWPTDGDAKETVTLRQSETAVSYAYVDYVGRQLVPAISDLIRNRIVS